MAGVLGGAGFAVNVSAAAREAGSSDLRQIVSPVKRASMIVERSESSTRAVAQVLGISQSAVSRGVHAAAEGRSPGKVGRPTVLSEDEEKQLLEWTLDKFEQNRSASLTKVLDEVR